jgi:hypothetical protein
LTLKWLNILSGCIWLPLRSCVPACMPTKHRSLPAADGPPLDVCSRPCPCLLLLQVTTKLDRLGTRLPKATVAPHQALFSRHRYKRRVWCQWPQACLQKQDGVSRALLHCPTQSPLVRPARPCSTQAGSGKALGCPLPWLAAADLCQAGLRWNHSSWAAQAASGRERQMMHRFGVFNICTAMTQQAWWA